MTIAPNTTWNVTISAWSSSGYTANISDLGGIVAKVPAKTWRSKEATMELAERIARVPAMEALLLEIANNKKHGELVSLGMTRLAREILGLPQLTYDKMTSGATS